MVLVYKCKLMHNYIYKNALSKELTMGFCDKCRPY